MSLNISSVFIDTFNNAVKAAYQQGQKRSLQQAVFTVRGVRGDTHYFPKIGTAVMQPHAPQSDIIPANMSHSRAMAQLANYRVGDYIDQFDELAAETSTAMSYRKAYAEAFGLAAVRTEDQIILNALQASGTGQVVTAGSGLTVDVLNEARHMLLSKGVNGEDIWFVGHYTEHQQLLADLKVVSTDYNDKAVLPGGAIESYTGLKFIWIGDRQEGGLAKSGTTRECWMFARSAVGYAIGDDIRTAVDPIPTKASVLIQTTLRAGAVAIDNDGIVRVDVTE